MENRKSLKEIMTQKAKGAKRWCAQNKGFLIATGLSIGGTILLAVVGRKIQESDAECQNIQSTLDAEAASKPEPDYGRELVMKFFDAETGEPYNERGILCCETYAEDMYDCDVALEPEKVTAE